MPGEQVALRVAVVSTHSGDQQLCHVEGELGENGDEGQVPGTSHNGEMGSKSPKEVHCNQASLLLDAKVERSDIAGMEENLHPVARSFSNQSFQATAGRSQNRLEPKTSSENFRHNPEMSDLSTLASKSKDA